MSKNLFISYRRADSDAHAGRINDSLKSEFNVFFDVDGGIGYGEIFPKVLSDGVANSDVLLVIMGKEYATYFHERANQKDFVLEEVLEAKRLNKKIIPILVDGAIMPKVEALPDSLAFLPKLNAFEVRTNKFHIDIAELKSILHRMSINTTPTTLSQNSFVQEVLDSLERERLLVLFSQDFTPIDSYIDELKSVVSKRFDNEFYLISIPPYLEEEEEYFACVAQDCGISCDSYRVSDWNRAMREKLKSSSKPLLLFVINIENGNEELDKRFATSLRNLKNEFSNFYAICVGRKDLAKLVYAEGHLSPLNTAKEIFFPENGILLGEERIVQQFNTLSRYAKRLCRYLSKDDLGRFSIWSSNDLINQLFWKNLLVKKGKRFAWRGELTREIGIDVLGCDEDMDRYLSSP